MSCLLFVCILCVSDSIPDFLNHSAGQESEQVWLSEIYSPVLQAVGDATVVIKRRFGNLHGTQYTAHAISTTLCYLIHP